MRPVSICGLQLFINKDPNVTAIESTDTVLEIRSILWIISNPFP